MLGLGPPARHPGGRGRGGHEQARELVGEYRLADGHRFGLELNRPNVAGAHPRVPQLVGNGAGGGSAGINRRTGRAQRDIALLQVVVRTSEGPYDYHQLARGVSNLSGYQQPR